MPTATHDHITPPRAVPKPRPRRTNWRARAEANEAAAALLSLMLDESLVHVERVGNDAVLTIDASPRLLQTLAVWQSEKADLEPEEDICATEYGELDDSDDEDDNEDCDPSDYEPEEPDGPYKPEQYEPNLARVRPISEMAEPPRVAYFVPAQFPRRARP